MTAIYAVIALIFAAGVAAGLYATFAPRKTAPQPQAYAPLDARPAPGEWRAGATAEFAALPEAARCDLLFASAELRDAESARLLRHALDDASDAVALAAAHVLRGRGEEAAVEQYAREHPGERASRLLQTLALLG